MIRLSVGDLVFMAKLERERAPLTVATFLRLLPLSGDLLQARWSGEAAWMGRRVLWEGTQPIRLETWPV